VPQTTTKRGACSWQLSTKHNEDNQIDEKKVLHLSILSVASDHPYPIPFESSSFLHFFRPRSKLRDTLMSRPDATFHLWRLSI
jgi:hypothetical protein